MYLLHGLVGQDKFRVIGIALQTFSGKLGGGFFQNPERQQRFMGVICGIKLLLFHRGEDLLRQAQVDRTIQDFRIQTDGITAQSAESVTFGVRNGKIPGTVHKIRLSSGGAGDGR